MQLRQCSTQGASWTALGEAHRSRAPQGSLCLAKARRESPDLFRMPYLLAAAAASAAGWLSDAAVGPVAGTAGSMVLSLVVSSVVFLFAKRFFEDLRGGR